MRKSVCVHELHTHAHTHTRIALNVEMKWMCRDKKLLLESLKNGSNLIKI